jgi:hypothetical protein
MNTNNIRIIPFGIRILFVAIRNEFVISYHPFKIFPLVFFFKKGIMAVL